MKREKGPREMDPRNVKQEETRGRKLWVEGSLRVVWDIGVASAASTPETL